MGMKNRFQEAIQNVQRQRHLARRSVAMVLVLAMLTAMSVSWRLHQDGIALAADDTRYYCGKEEHKHTDDCYIEGTEPICGYEEGEIVEETMDSADDAGDGDSSAADWDEAGSEPESEPATQEEPEPEVVLHHHTADCYEEEEVLTCGIESDHVHQDYCYDQETGELLCTEHEHTDDCYTLEEVLVCGQEEGEPEKTDDSAALYDMDENSAEESDSAEEPETAADPEPEQEATKPETDDEIDTGYTVHHHTAECYGKVLICGKEEHEHTAACLVNPNAEIDAEYDAKTPDRTSVDWAQDMVLVARSQLGYTESKADVDEDGNGYTMYADQYYKDKPMVYADWDSTFVAYCLYHAGVPQDIIPQYASISALRGELARMNSEYYTDDPQEFASILPGDIVMYKNAEGRETIGVVSDAAVDEETDLTTALTVISGDVATGCESDGETTIDQVAEVEVALNDVTSFVSVNAAEGYGISDLMDGEQGTVEDNETLRLEKYVTKLVLKKIINDTAVEIGKDEAVIDGNELQITFGFTIPAGTMNETNRTMVYKLPAGVKLDKVETGKIMPLGGSGDPIGTYQIETNGTITLTFNQKSDSFDPSKQVTGEFYFTAKADASQVGGNGSVSFPGAGATTTIQIASKADIQVEKTCTEVKEDANGKRTAYFKVVVSTGTRTGTPLTIVDQITNWNGANLTGSYIPESLKVYGPTADTAVTAPYTTEFTKNSSGFPQFTITGLQELVQGQTYTVVYEVELGDNFNSQGYGRFHNYAYAQSGEAKGEANFEKTWNNLIVKNGTYDEKNREINWEITVTRPDEVKDLKDYVVSDAVKAGVIKNGEVKITYVNGQSQTQELTSGKLTINDGKKGFTYTFPENSTAKEYKIKYTTTVPSDAESVTNGANIVTPTKKTYTDYKTITIEHRSNNTVKQKAGDTIRAGRYADWKITQTIANDWTEFTIDDTISARNTDGNALENVHYAYASELDAELKKMEFALTDGSTSKFTDLNGQIDISIQYYADDEKIIQPTDTTTKIKKFVIQVKKGSYDGTPIKSMEVSYSTQLDLSKIEEGQKLVAVNTANNVEQKYEYTKPTTAPKIEKKSSDQEGNKYSNNYKDTGVTVKYKEDGTYIYYRLYVNVLGTELSSLNGSLTVEDVLQEGLEFVPRNDGNVDVSGWFCYKETWGNSQSDWGPGSWGYWNLNYGHLTAKPSDHNRKLSITISGLPTDKTWVDTNPADKPTVIGIYIQYKAKVVDLAWKSNPKEFEKGYTNEASWGGESASTTTTVKRTNEELTKSAVQENNKVHYTLNINKLGLDLLPNSDRILLEDVLTVNTQSPATLDLDSVQLYEANSGKLLDKESYEFSYARTTEGENYKYTITLKVPDDVALTLKYDYTFDLSVYRTPWITNTAKLNGLWNSGVQEKLQEVSSGANAGNNALTVYKVDSLNESLKLKGAVFTLEAYKDSAWETIQQNITTDDNGKFVLSVGTTAENKLQQNVLYKLTEQTAPVGYLKDDTAHYFIWKTSGETDENAWNAAVGAAGLSEVGQNAVHFYAYGTAQDLLVSNERGQLTINKRWQNSDGETTTPPQDTSVTVELYRYQKNAEKDTAVRVKQITLSTANNWTAVYPGAKDSVMDPDYRYFVKEVNTNSEYDVLYSENNEIGVEKGGVINITNRHKPDKLTVTKVWAGDSENISARPTQITVELYGYAKTDTPDTAKRIREYQLEKEKGWTLTIGGLNAEMYYYIKEIVPDGYEVSYSNENGLQTGESVTLTNTKTIVYELPSTGSPGGTVPYTAGGAAIALAAVLCGYNSRRKRKRGEE